MLGKGQIIYNFGVVWDNDTAGKSEFSFRIAEKLITL